MEVVGSIAIGGVVPRRGLIRHVHDARAVGAGNDLVIGVNTGNPVHVLEQGNRNRGTGVVGYPAGYAVAERLGRRGIGRGVAVYRVGAGFAHWYIFLPTFILFRQFP